MAKTVPFEHRGGLIWIRCPYCKTEQVLKENERGKLGRDGYDIDRDGVVKPVWVCMPRIDGKYCKYECEIQLCDY